MDKFNVLLKKDISELLDLLLSIKKDIFTMRLSNSKSHKKRLLAKQVARIKTILIEREIEKEKEREKDVSLVN